MADALYVACALDRFRHSCSKPCWGGSNRTRPAARPSIAGLDMDVLMVEGSSPAGAHMPGPRNHQHHDLGSVPVAPITHARTCEELPKPALLISITSIQPQPQPCLSPCAPAAAVA